MFVRHTSFHFHPHLFTVLAIQLHTSLFACIAHFYTYFYIHFKTRFFPHFYSHFYTTPAPSSTYLYTLLHTHFYTQYSEKPITQQQTSLTEREQQIVEAELGNERNHRAIPKNYSPTSLTERYQQRLGAERTMKEGRERFSRERERPTAQHH